MIDALRTALGNDLGLASAPGFVESGGFMAHVQGPTGAVHNFADGRADFEFRPALLWMAHEAGHPERLKYWSQDGWAPTYQANRRFQAFAPIWWSRMDLPQQPSATEFNPALSWFGEGKNPVAYFRDSWSDPDAMWLGAKGGRANLSHGHMDAGSFVLEADGVRWAIDLGATSYHKLESAGLRIWNRSQNSDRWKVYPYRNEVHNTLTVDGEPMRVDASSIITAYEPIESAADLNGSCRVDLTASLGKDVASAQREFVFVGGPQRRVHIKDALHTSPGTPVAWTMMTEAQAELGSQETKVTLRQDGKSLELEMADGNPGRWVIEPYVIPEGFHGEARPEVTRLQWRTEADPSGRMDLHVVLRPEAKDE